MADPALAEVLAERRHLLDVAEWLAGPGAEQVADEAYRAWYALTPPERAAIVSPTAWLTRAACCHCVRRLAAPPPWPSAPPPVVPYRAAACPPDEFSGRFRAACAQESATALGALLAPGVTAWFDGGGKVRTADRPVQGRAAVTAAVLALLAPRPGTKLHRRAVNGGTGLVVQVDGQVGAIVVWRAPDRVISELWVVLNPVKVRSFVTNPPAVLS
jgi:RNA polymerase sigma-70 factor (ECF subfamily)